ncbi:MAG: tetratricopeptide repeat protein [Acidobacteriaceae bacterium]
MGLFAKLRGKSSGEEPPKSPQPPAAPAGSSQPDPNLIRVFDEFGRELSITKDTWRTKVLPGSLKSNWDNPDQLYTIIVGSLNDGFFSDVLDAAKHLAVIDKDPARGACVYGIVLMKSDRLDDAERVFQTYIESHGDDASILTNLAKVYSARNENERSLQTLWRSIQLDPNQANGLAWYIAIYREKDGEQAALDTLRRVAKLLSSWRAQLWLARTAITEKDIDGALALYREGLANISGDIPADFLIQLSGDLGRGGYLRELLQLTEPRFVPQTHGLLVGNNLIKAHLDSGQIADAQTILNGLYSLNRPDYKQQLGFWDTEIAKAKLARVESKAGGPLQVGMSCVLGPVWLPPTIASQLITLKPPESPVICFLGSSAETASPSEREHFQMSDDPGRTSRALPLFLAEQVWFNTAADVQILIPLTTGNQSAFVLSGAPWKDEDAARYSNLGDRESDFVVITHLNCTAESWSAELRLVRSVDHECVAVVTVPFQANEPQKGATELAKELRRLLAKHSQVEALKPPPWYRVPAESNLRAYLLRLEQLLAVRCAGIETDQPMMLNNEREIIDGNLQLCVAVPDNVCTRIILAQTLKAMKRVRPDVVGEFKDKTLLLQRKKPLEGPAQEFIQRMINEAVDFTSPQAPAAG